mmetsp:Transcript_22934/g.64034  ORF Transcript_22934/g.64034 Transcript_22934/m.64034 type:complete len:279 (-) Transcript_22934:122-958(-)
MVPLVPWRAAQDLGEEAVAHPPQVVPRVRLGQQVRDDQVVREPAHRVLAPEAAERRHLLDEDVHGDLEGPVEVRVLDRLQRVERVAGHPVVVPVHPAEPSPGRFVHQPVDGEEAQVVEEDAKEQLAGEGAKGRRRRGQRRLLVYEAVEDPYRAKVRGQGVEPQVEVLLLGPFEGLGGELPVKAGGPGPLRPQDQVQAAEERDRGEETEGCDVCLEERGVRRSPGVYRRPRRRRQAVEGARVHQVGAHREGHRRPDGCPQEAEFTARRRRRHLGTGGSE